LRGGRHHRERQHCAGCGERCAQAKFSEGIHLGAGNESHRLYRSTLAEVNAHSLPFSCLARKRQFASIYSPAVGD
jgi:hypothetical protein